MYRSSINTTIVIFALLSFACTGQLWPQQSHDPAVAVMPSTSGTRSAPETVAAEARTAAQPAEPVIAGGDLLEISVVGSDFACGSPAEQHAMGCQVRVSSAGAVDLPLVGNVKVAGLSVASAADVIAFRLAQGYFTSPQVIVTQKEYATQGISVLGEVQKPGTYQLLGSHTLLQALSAAGGTTAKAGDEVSIVHRGGKNPEVQNLNTSGGTLVLPGDTVIVSKAGIVYVIGDVHLPSGLVMDDKGLTVLQAIAMAQGTNSTAALDRAMLLRQTSHGREQVQLPLNKILANKAPDPQLQANDIIYVPNSAARSATRRGLEAILQTATGVAIYRR